ncbi:MAG: hypothetical protein L3K14_09160 [Thermoplasmata archaeon]|nr:hypothetical protein [Thermoplasmata archaeon]
MVPPTEKGEAASEQSPIPVVKANPAAKPARRGFRPLDIWKRYLPPVRLVWIFLGVLAYYGGGFLNAASAEPLLVLPIVAALTDLGFQKARFPHIRFPDAAIAIGSFMMVLVWPGTISIVLISVMVAAVGLRHLLRVGGHPLFNPVAFALTVGFLAFGVQTSWRVGINLEEQLLVVALGAILIVKARHTWRFPVYFFGVFIPMSLVVAAILGAASMWKEVLLVGALSAQSVFFGFFMVSEPRTAPSARPIMSVYAMIVGGAAALFPLLFLKLPLISGLGAITPFLALFIGNAFTVLAPGARGARAPSAAPKPAGIVAAALVRATTSPLRPGLAASTRGTLAPRISPRALDRTSTQALVRVPPSERGEAWYVP